MFKTIVTLMRGAAAAAEEEVVDRSALLILDQQIRDAAAAIERSKRALAVAIAQDEAEGKRLDTTLARIADLEERVTAALGGGREDLAAEGAEAIALMEADRDAIREARAAFAADIGSLKSTVAIAGHRLSELERGRRIALAAESVRRLKSSRGPGATGAVALAEAESTLRRLRERQAEDAAAEAAYDRLDPGMNPTNAASKLEAAGFGRRTRPTASDVLTRLREKARQTDAKPADARPTA
jgi:phage shock protein A